VVTEMANSRSTATKRDIRFSLVSVSALRGPVSDQTVDVQAPGHDVRILDFCNKTVSHNQTKHEFVDGTVTFCCYTKIIDDTSLT